MGPCGPVTSYKWSYFTPISGRRAIYPKEHLVKLKQPARHVAWQELLGIRGKITWVTSWLMFFAPVLTAKISVQDMFELQLVFLGCLCQKPTKNELQFFKDKLLSFLVSSTNRKKTKQTWRWCDFKWELAKKYWTNRRLKDEALEKAIFPA